MAASFSETLVGKLALVRSGSDFEGGLVVDENRKGFAIELADGRRLKSQTNQLLAVEGSRVECSDPGQFVGAVRSRLGDLDLRTAWELLLDDGDGTSRFDDILALCGEVDSAVDRAALLVLLDTGGSLFKRKGDLYAPVSAKAVAEREEQEARARQREEQFRGQIDELRSLDAGELSVEQLSDEGRAAVLALQQCAIAEEPTAAATKLLAALFPQAAGGCHVVAFTWLVKLGVLDEHEDLFLRRLDAREEFPAEVEENARELAERVVGKAEAQPLLEGIEFVAIDDDETEEVDDAIGLEPLPDGGCRVHVVICDVASGVPRDSAVDREAAERGTTIYHPAKRIVMLPKVLAEQALSLTVGEPRLVLDHVFSVDAKGSVYDFAVRPAKVILSRRLTYEEADAELLEKPEGDLVAIQRVADGLFNERITQGAVHFYPVEVKIRVVEGDVTVKPIDSFSPSRRLVSEFMVGCGGAVGRMLAEQMVTAIYRRQVAPSDPIEWDEESARDPVYILENVRKLKRAGISLQADRHHALGLMAYTQVTSPLRRYGDLLMQRQLHSYLVRGVAEYGDGELLKLMSVADQMSLQVRKATNAAERYWALVALSQRGDEPVEALVLDDRPRREQVLIPEYGLQTKLFPRGPVHAGDQLKLKVSGVVPRTDTLVLTEVESQP
jgi:exoribonuclease II